jgi:hypothetical protein
MVMLQLNEAKGCVCYQRIRVSIEIIRRERPTFSSLVCKEVEKKEMKVWVPLLFTIFSLIQGERDSIIFHFPFIPWMGYLCFMSHSISSFFSPYTIVKFLLINQMVYISFSNNNVLHGKPLGLV